ncbi:MAG: hypothetical protein II817_10465 [Bacteroidales bacterium]|nr:hypothetical protein [Bacteroidales bacterium]
MGFFMFHRPEMPKFNYIPRYYNPEKEELEKRKAALGLDSNLTDSEKLRVKMRAKWGRTSEDGRPIKRKSAFSALRIALIVGISAFFISLIFFTPFVENFVTMFMKLGGK